MDWYYALDGQQKGPVSQTDLDQLVATGVVGQETLVWHAGMPEWKPLRLATAAVPPLPGSAPGAAYSAPSGAPPPQAYCGSCGRAFPPEDLMQYGDSRICAECKPAFLQRLRQGVPLPTARRYAGFWIRFLAILIDGLILGAVSIMTRLFFVAPVVVRPLYGSSPFSGLFAAMFGVSSVINLFIGIAYQVYFLTRHGATPGKLALGLRVITADGGPISVGRAIGRYFGYWLDTFTLAIGYIIAAFDSEKRALHDYICSTRVIYSK
jgi:uncharacterized RDD family membrane protein YckC